MRRDAIGDSRLDIASYGGFVRGEHRADPTRVRREARASRFALPPRAGQRAPPGIRLGRRGVGGVARAKRARLRLTVLTVFRCVGRRGDVEAGDAERARDGVGGAEAFRAPRLDERKRRARVREMRRAQRRRHRLERPDEPRLRVHRVAPSPRGTPASSAFRTARRLSLRRRLRSQRSRRGRARLFPARARRHGGEGLVAGVGSRRVRIGRVVAAALGAERRAQRRERTPHRRREPHRLVVFVLLGIPRAETRAELLKLALHARQPRLEIALGRGSGRGARRLRHFPRLRPVHPLPLQVRDARREIGRGGVRATRRASRVRQLSLRGPQVRFQSGRRGAAGVGFVARLLLGGARARQRGGCGRRLRAGLLRRRLRGDAPAALLARLRARPGGGAARLRLVPRGVRARRRELREERGDAHGARRDTVPVGGPVSVLRPRGGGFPRSLQRRRPRADARLRAH